MIKIELKHEGGKLIVAAVHSVFGIVAAAEGTCLDDTLPGLINTFTMMQADTITALRACGLVNSVVLTQPKKPEELS